MSQPIPVDYLIRSHRKTVALIIRPDGSLEVRAPQRTSLAEIQKIIQEKANWISRSRAKILAKPNVSIGVPIKPGKKFWYLGHAYPLRVSAVTRNKPAVTFQQDHFELPESAHGLAESLFTHYYREQARQILKSLTAQLALQHQFNYSGVRISSARTRWGSCSQANHLSFTWRLIMAPPSIIEYVVIHELAHTAVKNHSREFWATVERAVPDFRQRRAWFGKNGALLDLTIDADEALLQ